MQNRREFLAAAGGALAAGPAEWRNRQSGMTYRRLGRTGFMVSGIAMGGNTIAPDNCDHVLEALDMGLNYLDTAPAYGNGRSEQGYARVIRARGRDRFFLNTKVSPWDLNRNRLYRQIFDSLDSSEQARLNSAARQEIERRKADAPDYFGGYFEGQPQELEAAALSNVMAEKYGERIDRRKNYRDLVVGSIEESLARLGTDHVDLMMCPHGANTPYEVLRHPEIFEAFETLRKAGKVRFLGVSAHTDPAGILEAAVQARVYSVAMVAYNIVNHPYVERAVAHAAAQGLGVLAMKAARPVFNNRGREDDPRRVKLIEDAVPGPLNRAQKAYAWALRNPNLSGIVAELVDARMVREDVPLAAAKKT